MLLVWKQMRSALFGHIAQTAQSRIRSESILFKAHWVYDYEG
jgi:hypothetical protein